MMCNILKQILNTIQKSWSFYFIYIPLHSFSNFFKLLDNFAFDFLDKGVKVLFPIDGIDYGEISEIDPDIKLLQIHPDFPFLKGLPALPAPPVYRLVPKSEKKGRALPPQQMWVSMGEYSAQGVGASRVQAHEGWVLG